MTDDDQGAADAPEIPALAHRPGIVRTLRRWYLCKRIKHFLLSAVTESRLSQQHNETARYFLALATAARDELENLEGK